ncbi:CLUMA_CG018778, isoform A [Clunio marinus]|uniref:Odorant receptor n=1 Tax=Clunio marinus TaxID=568069 RepID=A0A1J1IZW9_9DIPT|nr:CLUMA_CG018778, isoform A [Clunio marinus]
MEKISELRHKILELNYRINLKFWKNNLIFLLIVINHIAITFLYLIYGYSSYADFSGTDMTEFFILMIRSNFYWAFVYRNSDKIKLFASKIISDRKTFSNNERIIKICRNYERSENYVLLAFIISGTLSALMAIVMTFFTKFNNFHLPMNFYIFFLPLNESSINWWINYFYQANVIAFGSILANIYFPLTLWLINHSSWGHEVLISCMKEFHEVVERKSTSNDVEIDHKLNDVVKQSYLVLYDHEEIRQFLKFNFLIEFSLLAIMFCMSIYTITTSAFVSSFIFTSMLYPIAQVYIYCAISSKVMTQVDKLVDVIYETSWYTLNTNQRKALQLMLCKFQNFKGFNGIFIKVDMDAFQKLMIDIVSERETKYD